MRSVCKSGWSVAACLLVALMAVSASAADLVAAGSPAPEFPEQVEWFGGKGVTLAEYKGKKAVLLYFLLPGCGSCDHFAPHLYRLALQNKDDVAVIGLTAHPKKDEVEAYAQKRLGDYPVACFPDKEYISRYIGNISQFPYLVIIGKDGLVKWQGRGKFHEQVTEELERALGKKAEPVDIAAGKRSAVVVSVPQGLGPLKAPAAEGAAVAQALTKAGYEKVVVLGQGGSDKATPDTVKAALNKLGAQAGAQDAVVFFFTGDAKQVNLGGERRGIELLLEQGELPLSDLHAATRETLQGKQTLWILDANHEDSSMPEWEDLGAAVSAELPGVSLLLASARYDRSHLLEGDPAGTVFGSLLLKGLQAPCGKQDLASFWRYVRDEMGAWSRGTEKGTLQSPFLYNPGMFSVLPGGAQ